MANKLGHMRLEGASGEIYVFTMYEGPVDLGGAIRCVYCVTRALENDDGCIDHTIFYFGQTEDLNAQFQDDPKADCFARHGANSVGIYLETNQQSRLMAESDLISHYQPVCNNF